MEHEIINMKDIETVDFAKTMRKVDLQNMQCTIHGKEKCFIYCKDCSEPACSKCIIEVHQKHEYKALDEVYERIIADINEIEDKIESNLQLLKREKNNLLKMLPDGDANFQETRDIILQTEKEMKEAISKFAEDLLQKLEKKWKSSENMIKTELSAMTKKEDELETRMSNINQALQSHHVADILSTSKTLDTSSPKYSVKQIKQKKSKFIPSNLQVNIGSKMFGGLYTVPDFELIDTYQSDVENVTGILLSSDNNAFIGSYYHKNIQKIKIENHNIKVEKEVQITVCDMALTKDGEILASSTESALKLYTKDGQLNTFKSFSPLKTLGVHVTKDNKIIVGLTESFPVQFPPTKDSIRKLSVMNKDGDIQHTIEYDTNNQRLLTYPRRINSFNDKIVVVDIVNTEYEGRIVMLDYGGQLHWIYNGCNSINSDHVKFYPRDLAITSTDMILVSDSLNHAIHVLNPDGEVIAYTDVKSVGKESAWSLSIDKKDVLWIGCNAWESDKKGKIHCVKLI
ncbi:E3 ubiquitin-protein ligase TRIM71-like [Mytilus californianus]|uniref:E3 ubiquitin-protein ligase TRIM71-like n=1 Tax=Mytilus californianus TaxID=6549 RepID=UPI002246B6AA|nr:E3 ubiquitin-protein ligase TRIM71-like [Mytilus californianus]